jgi:hypothetical protein
MPRHSDDDARPEPEPTYELPGLDRVAVYAERVRRGQKLFSEHDRNMSDEVQLEAFATIGRRMTR